MLTDRLSRFRFGSLRSLSPSRFRFSSTGDSSSSEVHSAPLVPAFRMDYTVNGSDTLERIAAIHDCTVGELMQLNRMSSRLVFPGQKIIVPLPVSDDVFEQASKPTSTSNNDSIKKGPGNAVPVQKHQLAKSGSAPVGSTDDADSDCLQRFLKIKVKQVTESDGTVAGTLLVTPNCLMFDPDVCHPLVKENGQDLYGMVANMEEIISVSVYKELAALTGDCKEKKKDIFDPSHVRTPEDPVVPGQSVDIPEDPVQDKVMFTNEVSDSESSGVEETGNNSSKAGSESFLPAISEETKFLDSPDDGDRKRAVSDITAEVQVRERSRSPSSRAEERPRSFSELDAPSNQTNNSRFSPNAARRSFGKLGRTLSARAKSGYQSVSQGAEKVAQTAVQGTKTVAHGVVTHTKSAADSLQTGIETSVKVVGEASKAAANQAKAAADVVAAVPGKVVDMGTSFVSDGINGVQEMFNVEVEEQRTATQMKREQSLATLEGLKFKTQLARDEAAKNKSLFSCATSSDEMPNLFLSPEEIIAKTQSPSEPESPQLPYYMAVRLTRKKRRTRRSSPNGNNSVSSYDEDIAFGNKLKREFWFAVPREKADNIYHFLLQWSPEKYGQDTTTNSLDELEISPQEVQKLGEKGFLILDSTADENLAGDKPGPLFGSSLLNREWELVTVTEMYRRLSLDDSELEIPLPEGSTTSQIMDELMIRQVIDILPPRAVGYPWVNIYSSEKHGFSLATLYRKMIEFDEDLSPVLLIIRDTEEHVFGAIVSGAIRPSEHFTGTGDSSQVWRFTGIAPHTRELRQYSWTGDNQFFVNASKEYLAIGAGSGHYGLWLDADLNHGRTQRCDTFDNEPLTGDKEDFIIQYVEAYGFRI